MVKIATYNILLSRHPDEIIKNITSMAHGGVAIFCLQEVLESDDNPFIIEELLSRLGKDWKAASHVGDGKSFLDFGTSIIWNSRVLQLEKTEKILLPTAKRLTFPEWAFHKLAGLQAVTPPRRAISCLFNSNNKQLLVTSVHLDSVGGKANRLKQLRYLLRKANNNYHIVCGDFNSFDLLKTGQEEKNIQRVLGATYVDATKDIAWSADINRMDTPKHFPFFIMLIKSLQIHIKRKLDYIWVKNLNVKKCKVLDAKGSDHLPVIANLELN